MADWEKARREGHRQASQVNRRRRAARRTRSSPNSPGTALQRHDRPAGPVRHPRRHLVSGRIERRHRAALRACNCATLIADWRGDWNEGDFPFLFVQLPNFMDPQTKPSEAVGGWPRIREAILQTLRRCRTPAWPSRSTSATPRTSIPRTSRTSAGGWPHWALAKTYGKDVVPSGPLYKSMRSEGDKIVIEFNYAGRGLAARDGDKLKGFAIAGADKKFVWADATDRRRYGRRFRRRSKSPAAVRYAWANNPDCNLDQQGRPARLAFPHRRLERVRQPPCGCPAAPARCSIRSPSSSFSCG